MLSDEKLKLLRNGFEELTEEGKECILSISQALVFAQNTFSKPPFNDGDNIKSNESNLFTN